MWMQSKHLVLIMWRWECHYSSHRIRKTKDSTNMLVDFGNLNISLLPLKVQLITSRVSLLILMTQKRRGSNLIFFRIFLHAFSSPCFIFIPSHWELDLILNIMESLTNLPSRTTLLFTFLLFLLSILFSPLIYGCI